MDQSNVSYHWQTRLFIMSWRMYRSIAAWQVNKRPASPIMCMLCAALTCASFELVAQQSGSNPRMHHCFVDEDAMAWLKGFSPDLLKLHSCLFLVCILGWPPAHVRLRELHARASKPEMSVDYEFGEAEANDLSEIKFEGQCPDQCCPRRLLSTRLKMQLLLGWRALTLSNLCMGLGLKRLKPSHLRLNESARKRLVAACVL